MPDLRQCKLAQALIQYLVLEQSIWNCSTALAPTNMRLPDGACTTRYKVQSHNGPCWYYGLPRYAMTTVCKSPTIVIPRSTLQCAYIHHSNATSDHSPFVSFSGLAMWSSSTLPFHEACDHFDSHHAMKQCKTNSDMMYLQWHEVAEQLLAEQSNHLKLVSWYFVLSQPQRITLWLKTLFNLSPIHSVCKSSNHKSSKKHKISTDTNLHETNTQTSNTKCLKN